MQSLTKVTDNNEESQSGHFNGQRPSVQKSDRVYNTKSSKSVYNSELTKISENLSAENYVSKNLIGATKRKGMKSMCNLEAQATEQYVNQFVSNLSYKVPKKQETQADKLVSQKNENEHKTQDLLIQKRQNAKLYSVSSSRKLFNIALGKAPVIKNAIDDEQLQRSNSKLVEDKEGRIKSAYSLHKKTLTHGDQLHQKTASVLRKSLDYTNKPIPTVQKQTRKSDITGLVSLNAKLRPRTTLEHIEHKEEYKKSKEYKNVELKEIETLRNQLNETQKSKPAFIAQAKTIRGQSSFSNEQFKDLSRKSQPSLYYGGQQRNLLPKISAQGTLQKRDMIHCSDPYLNADKTTIQSSKNTIPSNKIGHIQLKSFDKRTTDDLIKNQMQSLRSMQKLEPTHQSNILLGSPRHPESKQQLLEQAYANQSPTTYLNKRKLQQSARRLQHRTLDVNNTSRSEDRRNPIEEQKATL